VSVPSSILTMLAGIALTLVSLWYGQNHGLMPVAASAEASAVDNLFNTMMTTDSHITAGHFYFYLFYFCLQF
jgi:cytochrome c oxidase subunit 2